MPKLPNRRGAEWAVVVFAREGLIVFGPFGSFTAAVDWTRGEKDWYGEPQITRLLSPRVWGPWRTLATLLRGRP